MHVCQIIFDFDGLHVMDYVNPNGGYIALVGYMMTIWQTYYAEVVGA
jgi:hypothetical protein